MEVTLKRTAVLITVSVLSLMAIFLYVGSNDINRHAIAQAPFPNDTGTDEDVATPFPNDTETIGELDRLLGNNTAVIVNDTNIDGPNFAETGIGENLKENCMLLPNTNHYYCP